MMERLLIFIEPWTGEYLSARLKLCTTVISQSQYYQFLRRPPTKYPEYRLDKLLKRKADEGVKIYIVVYKVCW